MDAAISNGVEVRKGSVAAVVANAKILQSLPQADPCYVEVVAQLRELVPVLRAVGVFDVFQPCTAAIAALVAE